MPTTEPNPQPASTPGISSIIASISSNEAKLLALERRLNGGDSTRATIGVPGSVPILVGNFSQFPITISREATAPGAALAASAHGVTTAVTDPAAGQRLPFVVAAAAAVADGTAIAASPAAVATAATAAVTAALPGTASERVLVEGCFDTTATMANAVTTSTGIAHTAATLIAGDDPSNKRRRTDGASHGSVPAAAPASPSNSRSPMSDLTSLGCAIHGPLPPLSAVLSDGGGAGSAALTHPQQQAVAGATTTGGSSNNRARKRKQQDPKHEATASVTAAAQARVAPATLTPSGGGTAAAAGALGAGQGLAGVGAGAGAVSTPRRVRGSAGPGQERAGNPTSHQNATPPGLARHLFDEPGSVAGAAGGLCGRNSNAAGPVATAAAAAAGGNGRVAAAVAAVVAPTPPSSAQKRNILSYYPPVMCTAAAGGGGGGHALTAAATPPFVPDQNSRDSMPLSTLQRQQQQQQQQQQQRADVATAAAASVNPAAGGLCGVETSAGGDCGTSASVAASQLQLRQSQQQITQLQAQVMQVQAAMAAQQAAAGAEIERLRAELQARCLEAASLQERSRVHEAAMQQAVAGEAAARAALEALQAASASEAARRAAEMAEAARLVSEREARYRGELTRLVQSFARTERELSRNQLSGNAARLGSLTLVRTGPMQIAEVWEEGTAFQQLAARRSALTAAKEEVMAAQKLLRKRLAPPPSGARGSGSASSAAATNVGVGIGDESNSCAVYDMLPFLSGLEFVAADEVYKTRLAVLKREEESVREEEERLTREKFKQIRAVKLAREEDASRFGRWPVLPDKPGPEGQPRYVLMNMLGKGGFSEVFKAYDVAEARPVCVKIHALASGWSSAKKESYVRHAIREYDIHRSLRHPAVVALLDVLEIDLDTFATVLELCDGGDLDGLLREHRTLPEREARSLMCQIFSGLRYLASRRIIHYDLKPANILFDSLGQAKITDFGLSKQVSEGQTLAGIELTSQGAGTYWYLPPEAFETGGATPPRISNKLDVWSAGVIFYSMLYGKKPYGEAMSQEQMLRERVMAMPREVDFPSRPVVSSEAKDFIRRCLAWHQDVRPDVEAAATDPYLTGSTTSAAGVTAPAAASAATGGGGTLSMGLAAVVSGGGGGGGSGGRR